MRQNVTVGPGELVDIDYLYDFSSIFANPEQQKMYNADQYEGPYLNYVENDLQKSPEEVEKEETYTPLDLSSSIYDNMLYSEDAGVGTTTDDLLRMIRGT